MFDKENAKKEIPLGLTRKQLFILAKEELQKQKIRKIWGANEISPLFWKLLPEYLTKEEFDQFQKEWKELCYKYADHTQGNKDKIVEKGVWRNF